MSFTALTSRVEALESQRATARAATPPELIDRRFPCQAALVEDTARLLVVLCTRRAAKSFSAGLRLLRAMYRHPGSSALFIALTRESAKKILWKDVLKVINRRFKLGAKFNETALTMTLPNGSVLYILGVDTTEEEKEKLLGQKYSEVAVDESASYTIDLFQLVFGVLKPAVADYRGAIGLYGTPGNLKRGLFFDLTNGQDPCTPGRWTQDGWSGHRWDTSQNPYMAENWRLEIEELRVNNPRVEETPLFQQHYLGRWTIDDSKLVYRYQPGRNDYDGELPEVYGRGAWHHTLSVDLGFTDACSFTVGAYHDNLKCRYVRESYKRAGLDVTGTAEEIALIKTRYDIEVTVVDGANKQAVEEMNNRHGTQAIAADKRDKAEFIDLMNADFQAELIKLSPLCEDLRTEYAGLIWDERALDKRKRKEHPSCENHCADGNLYGWRYDYAYLASLAPKPPPRVNTEAWYAEQAALTKAEMEAQMEAELERNRQARNEEMEAWT